MTFDEWLDSNPFFKDQLERIGDDTVEIEYRYPKQPPEITKITGREFITRHYQWATKRA